MRIKIGDACEFINGGSWTESDYRDNGLPVLKVSNFNTSGFTINDISYLNFELGNKYEKNKLELNDIIIATVGSHPSLVNSAAGRTIRVNSNVVNYYLNQNAICLRVKEYEIIDQIYLYYLTETTAFRNFIQQRGKGAANQMRIPISGIKDFSWDFPPLETQKKIASILSGYDDLIENNLKRIKILEEMAQQTYEEWFVRMRFPGHETATINPETGLPEGWEKVKLTDFAKITFGYPFKANDFNSEGNGTPIIRIRNIPKSETSDYTTEIVDEKYIVNNGDILIGMDGEFYLNFWTGNNGYLVQRVCRLIACDYLNQGYLLEALKVPINYYQNSIDGATVAHLGKKHLDEIEIVLPNIDLAFFQNLMNQKINLSNQNQRLREARDILLPRLMMGMIEV